MKMRLFNEAVSFTRLVLAACLWLAGCTSPGGLFGLSGKAFPFRDPALSMQGASDVVQAGQTTKADVLAALGPATVVKFDSAYEVWVYRGTLPGPSSAGSAVSPAEFVILFTPAGLVKKSRIKPAYGKAGS